MLASKAAFSTFVDEASQLTALHLQPRYLQLEIQGQWSSFMRLRDLPELRQTLADFLLDLVRQNQHTSFAEVCGQCGNSCRRPEILVREQEILPKICGQELEVQTRQRIQEELGPLALHRPNWVVVDAAAHQLEKSALRILAKNSGKRRAVTDLL